MTVQTSTRTPRHHPHRGVAVVMLLLLALTGCSGGSTTRGGDTGFVGGSGGLTTVAPAQRKPAPDVTGTTLDGKTVTLSDFRGTVVVINVWGSWCPPCRVEAPDLVKAAAATRGKAQFLGINVQDTGKAQAEAFVRSQNITYPNVYDPDGRVLVQFAGTLPAQAIPSTLVLDAQGRVAARVLGATSERTLVGLIDDVVAGT